ECHSSRGRGEDGSRALFGEDPGLYIRSMDGRAPRRAETPSANSTKGTLLDQSARGLRRRARALLFMRNGGRDFLRIPISEQRGVGVDEARPALGRRACVRSHPPGSRGTHGRFRTCSFVRADRVSRGGTTGRASRFLHVYNDLRREFYFGFSSPTFKCSDRLVLFRARI